MSFIWPIMLLALLAIPLLIALYLRVQRRRRALVARYGSLGTVAGPGGGLRWRRHIPPALFMLALVPLLLGLARPQATVNVPRIEGTIILAFDVSASMSADDLKPSRLEAAKVAARAFVERQPPSVRIGVVTFSDGGLSVQVPTNEQAEVLSAINRLTPARGTSLGGGIEAALNVLAADSRAGSRFYTNRTPVPTIAPTPVPRGTYAPAAIVLLTDGENTAPPLPLAAAKAAADRGVRIHTVGIGSPAGAQLKIEGFVVQTRLDEETLKGVAQLTDGSYYNATTEQDLRAIYEKLNTQLVVKPERTEVTAIFAGIGLLLLLLGGLGSFFWLGRLP